jgi:hypothetical protein
MTSYCPQTRFAAAPDRWFGGEGVRYATRAEAEASLAEIIAARPDLLETRVVESIRKPTNIWQDGYSIPRGPTPTDRADMPKNYRDPH